MQSVSNFTNGILESQYFDVQYRPNQDRTNFDLNLKSSLMITNLALVDVAPNQRNIAALNKAFLEALATCNNVNDLTNFNTFIKMLADKGGYAELFYQQVSNKITMDGKVAAKNELEQMDAKQKMPVSKRLPNGSGIQTRYYEVNFRPRGGLSELDINASSLMTYMALADIMRDEERIQNLTEKFYECLVLCENKEDFNRFSAFMLMLSDIGGYAYIFHEQHRKEINFDGKEMAKKYLEQKEREKNSEEVLEEVDIDRADEMKMQDKLANFKQQFAKACKQLRDIQTASVKNDEDVADLLRMFNSLQADLYDFNGVVDKEFITNTDVQIEEGIQYLRGLYSKLEEIDRIMK